jgi:hypothetical protein
MTAEAWATFLASATAIVIALGGFFADQRRREEDRRRDLDAVRAALSAALFTIEGLRRSHASGAAVDRNAIASGFRSAEIAVQQALASRVVDRDHVVAAINLLAATVLLRGRAEILHGEYVPAWEFDGELKVFSDKFDEIAELLGVNLER